jgi:hypothetical protein
MMALAILLALVLILWLVHRSFDEQRARNMQPSIGSDFDVFINVLDLIRAVRGLVFCRRSRPR